MERIVGLLAAVGLAVALVVHVQTFYPAGYTITSDHPLFLALHVGVFVVFGPYILALKTRLGTNTGLTAQLSVFPLWGRALIIVASIYAFVNFALFLFGQGGTPEIRNGQFVLVDHGKLIRALSEQEYDSIRSHVTRGFSGHWMLFYLVPMLYFWFGTTSPQSETSRQSSSPDADN